jgi:hypothetical protein
LFQQLAGNDRLSRVFILSRIAHARADAPVVPPLPLPTRSTSHAEKKPRKGAGLASSFILPRPTGLGTLARHGHEGLPWRCRLPAERLTEWKMLIQTKRTPRCWRRFARAANTGNPAGGKPTGLDRDNRWIAVAERQERRGRHLCSGRPCEAAKRRCMRQDHSAPLFFLRRQRRQEREPCTNVESAALQNRAS